MSKKFFEPTDYNAILFESENFIVIPSLGSLLPGWLLIIPKDFYLNLSQLKGTELQELENLAATCERKLTETFHCEVVRFEHGPALPQSKVGCGVDYAHLHLVPVKFDLIDGLEQLLNVHYEWKELDSFTTISGIPSNSDYLYYRNRSNRHFIACEKNIPSQLFRRVIAMSLKAPETFDWKSFPQVKTIEETIKLLSPVELV
jgi:ATP adenylyltransferase